MARRYHRRHGRDGGGTPSLRRPGRGLRPALGPGHPPGSDRHRLRQLLLNLTDNAIKYNQSQGTVSLALARAGQNAEITISNTGAGVPQESLRRVFEPFFRGDSSHSQTVEGCGLGLSIARWIVSAHNGAIELKSIPGQLTTVSVRLPLASI